QGVAGQQREHVVEKADAGGDGGRARAVEVDAHAHVRLAGHALRLTDAAHAFLRASAERAWSGKPSARASTDRCGVSSATASSVISTTDILLMNVVGPSADE